ncbi:hypothetical protein K1W69_09145 [Hoeflea sp. WL0058]|uniref:Uncharacterized protein n=1 Tax=Flavimaribacter sediminis TaxID=2865987 RepID=A0AAE2ZPR8_9HYPH|nr:hypothetical protein [Flavimaribacter sediminis]MBW8637352.1 hypothetical protein [Flavimaribacter sediminis]
MKTRALEMPEYLTELLTLTFNRMGLQTPDTSEDAVTIPLQYEDGTELSLVILYVVQKGWLFWKNPKALVSVAELDQPWPHNLNQMAFGKPGAVQSLNQTDGKTSHHIRFIDQWMHSNKEHQHHILHQKSMKVFSFWATSFQTNAILDSCSEFSANDLLRYVRAAK